MADAQDIPLCDIKESRLLLRLVHKSTAEYLELRDSVAEHGYINSVCVRPIPDAAGKYEVVDGHYRYNVALDLRLATLPCIIKHGLTDQDVLALQIQANAIRPETTPTEYARQLKRLMQLQPGMALADLAHLVKKRPVWLRDALGLLALTAEQQKAVDRSEIPVTSAYMLAKIPRRFRESFVEQAHLLTATEFRPIAAAFIKQYAEAVRQGKLEVMFVSDFKPVANLRSVREVEDEMTNRRCGALLVQKADCTNPVEAWYLALQWALHLDPISVEAQRRAANARAKQHFFDNAAND